MQPFNIVGNKVEDYDGSLTPYAPILSNEIWILHVVVH